jgi:hypothetical protein
MGEADQYRFDLLGMKKRLTHWEQVDEPAHDVHPGPQRAKE